MSASSPVGLLKVCCSILRRLCQSEYESFGFETRQILAVKKILKIAGLFHAPRVFASGSSPFLVSHSGIQLMQGLVLV